MIAMHLEGRRKQMVVNRQAAIKRLIEKRETINLCAQTEKLPKARSHDLDEAADPCADMYERLKSQSRRASALSEDELLNSRYELVRKCGSNPKMWRRFSSIEYAQQR